jgi:hypothetical protein
MRRSKFAISSAAEAAAISIVGAHGATDVDVPGFVFPYLVVCVLPDAAITPLFVLSSLVHFSFDVGVVLSATLHWVAFLATCAGGFHRGIQVIFFYLLFVHTPFHYQRCWREGRTLALSTAALTTVVMHRFVRGATSVSLGEWRQRVVIAHVANELLHALSDS